MGILRKIGIGNDIRVFFEAYLLFFAQVNFNGRLLVTASNRYKKADQDDAEDLFGHFEISPPGFIDWRI
jgi:hypothetical protein